MKEMKCIVCEQDVDVIHIGDPRKGIYPCIRGGTMIIDHGYGSQWDKLAEGYDEVHAYICDKCYGAKLHLVKKVQVTRSVSWTEIPNDDAAS